MVPIMGRPLLQYWLDLLGPAQGCSEIIINTHYLPEPVRACVARSAYRDKITLVHEDVLLGTAGTLKRQLPRLTEDEAFVAHADNLTLFNLSQFRDAFANRPAGCIATMMTFETESPQTCGIVQIDEQSVVQRFHEKVSLPPGNLANAAVFYLGREAMALVRGLKDVEDISLDILPHMLGRINTWKNDIYHRDIGNLAALEAAAKDFPTVLEKFCSARNGPL
jgi:mannose-1-phosphate guanylyltransferase